METLSGTGTAPASWRDFWNRDNAIYVSERHRLLHCRLVATDMAALIHVPNAHVLDHGCGEAWEAQRLATLCGKLWLCDAAPTVVDKLKQRFATRHSITPMLPDALGEIPDGSLDLVITNSLVQYLAEPELVSLLGLWQGKLKPGGKLVVADVIRTGAGPLPDAVALLHFGWAGGFLLAAITGLIRTALSDYRKLRAALGLSSYTQATMEALLNDAGFTHVRRMGHNIGHNQARMAFEASKRSI